MWPIGADITTRNTILTFVKTNKNNNRYKIIEFICCKTNKSLTKNLLFNNMCHNIMPLYAYTISDNNMMYRYKPTKRSLTPLRLLLKFRACHQEIVTY